MARSGAKDAAHELLQQLAAENVDFDARNRVGAYRNRIAGACEMRHGRTASTAAALERA